MIEVAQFADQFTRLGLACQGLGLLGFGLHQRAQGGIHAHRVVRRPATPMARFCLISLPSGPFGVQLRLRLGDGGIGLPDLAGQRQAGAFSNLVLTMKQVRGMRGLQVFLDQVAQCPGLVTGGLDHAHRQSAQRLLQRLAPGRRRAIRCVLFGQDEVRHRFDGHQADRGIKGLINADRHLARGHLRTKVIALRLRLFHERLLQRHIHRLPAAVGGADEARQAGQFQTLTHQPHPTGRAQRDHQMQRHHQGQ